MKPIRIDALAFLGRSCEPARVDLSEGLNVICGASDTGKSFVLDSLDFMFGASGSLRDIPERHAYDRVRLSLCFDDKSRTTFERSVEGGGFKAFDDLDVVGEPATPPQHLSANHDAAKDDNLSAYLLERIDLRGKFLRRNAAGKTQSLSFRNLVPLVLVSEGEIQTTHSPFLTGQHVSATAEYALLKFLLTGLDDYALNAAYVSPADRAANEGKLDVLGALIEELRSEIGPEAPSKADLERQLARLDGAIAQQNSSLSDLRRELQELITARAEIAKAMGRKRSRLDEIGELLARFELLGRHYESDLGRLEAIQESGSLFAALEASVCPVCGAEPANQHMNSTCAGDVDSVIAAAAGESSKIQQLRSELSDTTDSLIEEQEQIESDIEVLAAQYGEIEDRIADVSHPTEIHQSEFRELTDQRTKILGALREYERLDKYLARRAEIAGETVEDSEGASSTEIPSIILDEFSRRMQEILIQWGYPDAERVFFDTNTNKRDFQIAGKGRGNTGKGLRAVTHAAAKVALMLHCKDKGIPHPGFLVLDSPLLAYWEPEGVDDDLSGTDIKDRFYRFLAGLSDLQVVVIENRDTPPEDLGDSATVIHFTKNPEQGRYGLFPH